VIGYGKRMAIQLGGYHKPESGSAAKGAPFKIEEFHKGNWWKEKKDRFAKVAFGRWEIKRSENGE
jgi:hypothetical protein